MKKNTRWITGIIALATIIALTLSMGALAENAETDVAQTGGTAETDAAQTEQDAQLQDAFDAYATAKRESRVADIEEELKSMVDAGTLTQDQADLILTYVNEQNALQNGVCPNCGYQYQTGAGMGRRGGVNSGKSGRGMGNGFRMK